MNSAVDASATHRSSRYLNLVLVAAVTIQICLYLNQTGGEHFFKVGPVIEESFYLVSLLLLVGVVFLRSIHHGKLARKAEAGRDQTDAMSSMFCGVKHKLNNDMQVVLGNAELAQILVNNGGDIARPVHNITAAASDAVERIEQLSVFGSTELATLKPVDLNSMFRESMAKLSDELPPAIALRMELEHLSAQVVADRHLLSLSLTHLIRLAVVSMQHGGEIVIRTAEYDESEGDTSSPVVARMYISRALSQPEQADTAGRPENHSLSDDMKQFHHGLKTTKALVERSGVKNVSLSRRGDESLFTMHFATERQSKPVQNDLRVSQLFS